MPIHSQESESRWNVYYEVYVDILFLVNFMMDYLLLLLVRRMLKCSATHGNIFLGAVIGAGLTCIVMVLNMPSVIKLILYHIFINTGMIQVGLRIKDIRSFVKAMIMLYIGSFLMGGILGVFQPYVRVGSLFFFLAIVGYYMALGIWKFISHLQKWNHYHCEVELYIGNKKHRMKALIDTGNGLVDPMSGTPVSIVGKETAKKLLEEEQVKNIRYVPYRTIGKGEGVLPVIRVERLRITGEYACDVENPMIGISEERVSGRGEYEMILNPNLF